MYINGDVFSKFLISFDIKLYQACRELKPVHSANFPSFKIKFYFLTTSNSVDPWGLRGSYVARPGIIYKYQKLCRRIKRAENVSETHSKSII